MRNIFLILVLFLGGCSSKQLYTLGDTSNIAIGERTTQDFIAIESVELPIYLMDSPIYRKDSPYHLKKIESANWIHSMDKHLTRVLISYLQKSMNNRNIYPYPWSNIEHIDKKVSLRVNKFIAYKNMVHLEATYQILNKNNKTTLNYFFNTKENIKDKSIESMIESMEKAYFRLSKDISYKL
jgi:uncharacterized lipoprotein YmbA